MKPGKLCGKLGSTGVLPKAIVSAPSPLKLGGRLIFFWNLKGGGWAIAEQFWGADRLGDLFFSGW